MLNQHSTIKLSQIQPETKFKLELGTDSRKFMELIYEFEVQFNIEINLDEAVKIITIQDAVG